MAVFPLGLLVWSATAFALPLDGPQLEPRQGWVEKHEGWFKRLLRRAGCGPGAGGTGQLSYGGAGGYGSSGGGTGVGDAGSAGSAGSALAANTPGTAGAGAPPPTGGNKAPIIAGAIGGLLLVMLILLICCYRKRRAAAAAAAAPAAPVPAPAAAPSLSKALLAALASPAEKEPLPAYSGGAVEAAGLIGGDNKSSRSGSFASRSGLGPLVPPPAYARGATLASKPSSGVASKYSASGMNYPGGAYAPSRSHKSGSAHQGFYPGSPTRNGSLASMGNAHAPVAGAPGSMHAASAHSHSSPTIGSPGSSSSRAGLQHTTASSRSPSKSASGWSNAFGGDAGQKTLASGSARSYTNSTAAPRGQGSAHSMQAAGYAPSHAQGSVGSYANSPPSFSRSGAGHSRSQSFNGHSARSGSAHSIHNRSMSGHSDASYHARSGFRAQNSGRSAASASAHASSQWAPSSKYNASAHEYNSASMRSLDSDRTARPRRSRY